MRGTWLLALALAAAESNPKEAAAAARLAEGFETQGQFDRAVVEYQKAIRLDPSQESYYSAFAHLLLRTQNFKEAVMVLEVARPRFPRSPQVALSLGVAYYAQRRFGEAIGAFLDASSLDPDAEQPLTFLGRILEHASERMDEVVARFRAFTSRHPDNWLGHFLLGKATRDDKSLQQSIALRPGNWEAHFELGTVQDEKLRDFPAAIVSFKEASRLAPKNPAPRYRLARLYSRTGEPEKAAAERALHEKLTEEEKAEIARRQGGTRHLKLQVE